MISHRLRPYFLQKTIDEILSSPDTYCTIYFDETTTSEIEKQVDVHVRYFSDTHYKVRVKFLKAFVFGHVHAKTVTDELRKTLHEFNLPHKCLFSLSSEGPNVNKAIKINIKQEADDKVQ